ncbi:MAG: phosphatidylglycerol lysyltransferase domain-containing protein [Herbinix sp.]|nr:phosphatidylglycerol lysyltransferase domain-containing protein [Herbinix sp.]
MVFEPIDLCHKNKIETIRKKYKHSLSSHAFSSLYLWRDKMELSLYLKDELFCIKRGSFETNDYFFPCGDREAKLNLITKLIEKDSITFQYIREEDKLFLEEYFPDRFDFSSAREDWEYIYDKDEQVSLSGGSFKHLRSKVHKGENAHRWSTLKLSKENASAAVVVTRRWNDEVNHNGESADINATLNALNNFDELNMSGVLLMEDQVPYAFAMGTSITEDTFDLHISKTIESDIDCYLKWELYKQLPDHIRYINREEDLGMEGLRLHKTEMKPVRFNELWKGWTRIC